MNNTERHNRLNEEMLKASSIMYKYLGNPGDYIYYFTPEEFVILQERLAELQD